MLGSRAFLRSGFFVLSVLGGSPGDFFGLWRGGRRISLQLLGPTAAFPLDRLEQGDIGRGEDKRACPSHPGGGARPGSSNVRPLGSGDYKDGFYRRHGGQGLLTRSSFTVGQFHDPARQPTAVRCKRHN